MLEFKLVCSQWLLDKSKTTEYLLQHTIFVTHSFVAHLQQLMFNVQETIGVSVLRQATVMLFRIVIKS